MYYTEHTTVSNRFCGTIQKVIRFLDTRSCITLGGRRKKEEREFGNTFPDCVHVHYIISLANEPKRYKKHFRRTRMF
jgi:hypothetical protein